jgi:hypothetical protein
MNRLARVPSSLSPRPAELGDGAALVVGEAGV